MKKPIKKYKVTFVTSSKDIQKTLEKLYTHFGVHGGTLTSEELKDSD